MLQMGLSAADPYWFTQEKRPASTVLYDCDDAVAHGMAGRTVSIGLADASGDRNQAESILNRAYGKRGYGSNHQIARTGHSVTFTASAQGAMIGTLTLSVDSPRRLSVETTFPDEVGRLRASRARLCELTKFAFDPAPDSRPLLAALFHIIFMYGTQRFDCTDLLIEVNPRHVRFYEVMLGFSRLGPLRTNQSVDAPAQLMHLRVADIRTHIDNLAGNGSMPGHSLYRYFFDWSEERRLRTRIRHMAWKADRTCHYDTWRARTASDFRRLFQLPTFRTRNRKRAAA